MRDSMIFYKSFFEAIKGIPEEDQAKIYNAIFEYNFYGKTKELSGFLNTIWLLIKPQLDANLKRYKNGRRGGRPLKSGESNITKTKPNNNQNETKPKPNNNVNVNVNVNKNEFILEFNKLKNTKFKMTKEVEKLYDFWCKSFTHEEIIKAIQNIPKHKWLSTIDYTPTIFLRTNKDWIDQCLNLNMQKPSRMVDLRRKAEDLYYQQNRSGQMLSIDQILNKLQNENKKD